MEKNRPFAGAGLTTCRKRFSLLAQITHQLNRLLHLTARQSNFGYQLVLKNLTLLLLKISKKNLATPLRWLNQTIQKHKKTLKRPAKAADVFSLPHDQLGQLVESGVIQEVPEDYAKEIATNDTDQAVAGAKYNGKTYAFPFGIESQVLFYNKSKLSADDVANYETITSKATFGATFKAMNAYATAPLFMSVGDTLFGEKW